jgi:hypothetical protein
LWGGKRCSEPARRRHLESGDGVVWGGPAGFVYHGIAPLKDGQHSLTGAAAATVGSVDPISDCARSFCTLISGQESQLAAYPVVWCQDRRM